jgi:hypothetical protein
MDHRFETMTKVVATETGEKYTMTISVIDIETGNFFIFLILYLYFCNIFVTGFPVNSMLRQNISDRY